MEKVAIPQPPQLNGAYGMGERLSQEREGFGEGEGNCALWTGVEGWK